MKTIATTCSCLALMTVAAFAETPRQSIVKTHPSQGEVQVVDGADAELLVHDEGFFVSLETENLTPDHVHTLWLVVINDPASCFDEAAVAAKQKAAAEDCNSRDVLLRSDEVQSDVAYAGGVIVGEDGRAQFAFHQGEGEMTGGWFGHGLTDASTAEIHLVVNDHGPLIDGREREMIGSYRDGCKDDSIPGPMPAAARADGMPGPNVCRLVQAVVFKLPDNAS